MFLQQWSGASWKWALSWKDPIFAKYSNYSKESCLHHRVRSFSGQRILAPFWFFFWKIRKNQKDNSKQQPWARGESPQLLRVDLPIRSYHQIYHVWILQRCLSLYPGCRRLYIKRQSDPVSIVMRGVWSQSVLRHHEILQFFPSRDPVHELRMHVSALHGQGRRLLHQEGNAGATERVLQPNPPQYVRSIDSRSSEKRRFASSAARFAG